jgi:hypothetical protein
VPAVINGIPFAFLYDTGSNQTFMNEDSARKHGLGHLFRKKSDLKCVDVETAGPQDTKTHHYIEADMVFQGATRQTYIHIISGEKDKPILLFGSVVTDSEKYRWKWKRVDAKRGQGKEGKWSVPFHGYGRK